MQLGIRGSAIGAFMLPRKNVESTYTSRECGSLPRVKIMDETEGGGGPGGRLPPPAFRG